MRLALIALLLAGCGTKVLELSPDAGPPPFQGPFCLKDPAAACDHCYDEWGTPTKSSCTDAAPAVCYPKDESAITRCIYCGGEQRACLKCGGMPAGANCMTCAWSDNTGTLCMICYDDTGKPMKDNCNSLRPELKN
jgi:hypothetical protein